jgi:5-methylcytosine-specific restriction enzyme A
MNIKIEKEKAKQLRQSRWWQTLIQDCCCYYCQKFLKKAEVTMDHLIPLAKGGVSQRSNVVPCCKDCNSKKQDKTAVEFALENLA